MSTLPAMPDKWEQPNEVKTYTQAEVIDLLVAERTRAIDIALNNLS